CNAQWTGSALNLGKVMLAGREISCGLYSFFGTGVGIAGWRCTQYDGIVARRFARGSALGFRLMMIVLLIAGIGAVVAGIVAIMVGLPVKEFSFGNTEILAGVVGICTGIIVLALAVVVGE